MSCLRSAARGRTAILRHCSAEEVNATLYQNHPYRMPVIGWLHEMEQLNLKDALAFYVKYYTPEQRDTRRLG